ncbi:HAMP domain-containing histidine kinase [Chelatococcus sambhunathii]|uniref:histidine kinase n=1 Tax=Chelatococcus sambhunathii TaxID=363953 RepID=A0ABU1DFJ0_9HYPH|nr:HAMP domain-containing sensor histidine kinase [Chelatococcus sambhunathii]MDR4306882.1 HAMP domain-containing histidine kinase [Chelatococcus sambhunathii]
MPPHDLGTPRFEQDLPRLLEEGRHDYDTARGFGLSGKLLALTALFVMVSEILIYVPSIANFRLTFLDDQLNRARTAALALEAAPDGMVEEPVARKLLRTVGARALALKTGEARRLLAVDDMPPQVALTIDRREIDGAEAVLQAFDTLLRGDKRVARVLDDAPDQGGVLEIVVDETRLRQAMLAFSIKVLLIALAISLATGALVYVALNHIIVRPVRRLTAAMVGFGDAPEDPNRIIVASDRSDEIGVAEAELERLQLEIHNQLQQKSRLAALGLAVSKINHDLRNLLASAQLVSDRLQTVPDPTVQKIAPRLVATLDRAISFCQSTLNYGAAHEHPPSRRMAPLADIVEEVRATLGLAQDLSSVGFVSAVERGLRVDADPDHVFRALLNLGRNALQALESRGQTDPQQDQIRVSGRREGAVVVIEISDTGPGVPEKAREHLFEPFQGSTRSGGTGLGLAIAAELVRAHGGSISLVEGTIGATFRITIPDRPIDLQARARERARA